VDEGFRTRFLTQDAAHERFFAAGRAGHWQFDLEAYVAHRLAKYAIGPIASLGLDTYGAPDRFLPPRHPCTRGDYGRQFSLIGPA
jgi:copper oxidase (laccase) domain-containing protein